MSSLLQGLGANYPQLSLSSTAGERTQTTVAGLSPLGQLLHDTQSEKLRSWVGN